MKTINVPVVLHETAQLPAYANPGDSGADLYANNPRPVVLYSLERKLIPTGLRVAIPTGYELQIRSRSGMVLINGIMVANAPATIDAGFRGEVKVILFNAGDRPFTIEPGMRIAQAVLAPVIQAQFQIVSDLDATERGDGSFGSSGV